MSAARDHHYIFAHQALPALFHGDPAKFAGMLAEHGDDFLHFLWDDIGKQLPLEQRVAPTGLGCKIERRDDGTALVFITLPTPQASPEAYFVAAVYRPAGRKNLFSKLEGVSRYLTLEYSQGLQGEPGSVLCEWAGQETHANFGESLEPRLEAFEQWVKQQLKEG